MKIYLLIASLFLGLHLLAAEESESSNKLDSKIDQVTVFLQGAQIKRTANVSYKSGNQTVIFEGISPQIQAQSLQMSAIGNFKIVDVKYDIAYPQPQTLDKPLDLPEDLKSELLGIDDDLIELGFSIEEVQNSIAVLNREKQLIDGNDLMTGKSARSDTMPVLREAISYYHEKMMEINALLLVAKKKMHGLSREQSRLSTRKNEINTWHQKANPIVANVNAPIHRVVATINASAAGAGKLEFDYMVTGAGWTPSYDIRAEKIEEPILLSYKSDIYQNTGNNWEDVKIKVSTGNPNRNNNRPILNPWYVDFLQQVYGNAGTSYGNSMLNMATIKDERAKESAVEELSDDFADGASFVPTIQKMHQLSVSYEVAVRHSIPSDGKGHTVRIKDEEIDAEYEYHSVPKMDQGAFLLAKIPNWNQLNLLSGNANLFFEGTYVGQSTINSTTTADTLLLSLGRDEAITVQWKKHACDTEESFFSKTTTKTNVYEIVVRNNKAKAIELDLLDQLPLTQNKEIEIKLVDSDGAEYLEEYGKLSWKIPLKAGETKKLRFSYSVKAPKGKVVAGI